MSSYGLVGPGNLGQAIIKYLSHRLPSTVPIYYYHPRKTQPILRANWASLEEVLRCQVVFLTVKPSVAVEVCGQIDQIIPTTSKIISTMAGISLKFLQTNLPVQPNQVSKIMLNLSLELDSIDRADAFIYGPIDTSSLDQIFRLHRLTDENQFDAVTAVFGSGLAFVIYLLETYRQASNHLVNLDESLLNRLFQQANLLIQSGDSQEIIDRIASRGGTTEKGLASLAAIHPIVVDTLLLTQQHSSKIRSGCENDLR